MSSGRLPAHLLLHQVRVINPTTAQDAYGNTTFEYAGAGVAVRGWLQQDSRSETFPDGRAPDSEGWLLMTNYADIAEKARITWACGPRGAMTFEVDGPPAPVYAGLAQAYHHTETRLRAIAG